jgi:organic hydroperoxide reductase OsmC/OhrA
MGREHHYSVGLDWSGNEGTGTASYRSYGRSHVISGEGKPDIPGSSDPHFRGDPARWNPEELLVAALSACHQLAYLHLCAVNGIVVTAYKDDAKGVMVEEPGGAGQFASVMLRPTVTISADSDPEKAKALHHDAHALCFIARSVNFPVTHEPVIVVEASAAV